MKDKLKIAVGAVWVFLFGWLGYQYIETPELVLKEYKKICFIGDTGYPGERQLASAKALREENPDAVFFLGDVIYPVGLTDDEDPQFHQKFYSPFSGNFDKYIVMGNHDQYSFKNNVWSKLAEKYSDLYFPNHYYTIKTIKNVCILAYNANPYYSPIRGGFELDQDRYIESYLRRTDCTVKIVLSHQGCLSSGKHGDAKGRHKRLCDKLFGKVDFLVAGHDHNLTRERVAKGTQSYVSGSASKKRDCTKQDPFCTTDPGFFCFESGKMEMTRIKDFD